MRSRKGAAAGLGALAAAACLCLPAGASAGTGAPFEARGSAKQVYATGLEPKARVKLIAPDGERMRRQRANGLGGVLFRKVPPGRGYRVRSGGATSQRLRVFSERPRPVNDDYLDQEIKDKGYGYITMRDGTKLAYYTRPPEDVTKVLPGGIELPEPPPGPRPTLIEYAGYGYADPDGPESGIATIGNLMGFNVVNVNMRGTGCSGGAFDFFEPMQSLDGYDIVETVARQPWVKGKPGLLGISYGGISQLFVGATRPPSLAAITPLSLIDQVQTTLFPGGILNTGFALEWAKDRIREARPATADEDEGQRWAWERIQNGDQTCAENQVMHGEAVNLLRKIRNNRFYRPRVADPLAPVTFVDKINVPTFLACQWQDEQTGGFCPNMADRFTGTDTKRFTFTNGTHVDALAPETFNDFFNFLNIYVAEQAPGTSPYLPVVQAAAPVLYEAAFGTDNVTLPPDPIWTQPTLASAKAAFEAEDQVHIRFENGSGGSDPGDPYPGFEAGFDRFPIPGTKARSWFVRGEGRLGKRPEGRTTERFAADPRSTPPTNFSGDTGNGDLWTETPSYHWEEHPKRNSASFITKPLAQDTTVIGAGKVVLWARSARPDVDLQATISEVRPDGKEVFVQGGWLRASYRKLDPRKSSKLEPILSGRKRHVEPMPEGRFTKLTIPLYYEGHPYRAGSRIRVVISGVHGDQPIWAFDKARPRKGATAVTIASSKRKPSKLTLPVVPGVAVPDGLPPCPGLRGQPCRDFSGG